MTDTPATTPEVAKAKTSAKRVPKTDKTPLKTVCAQLKVDPKAARRKLRKAGPAFHGKRERWMLTPAQVAKVKEILRPPSAK